MTTPSHHAATGVKTRPQTFLRANPALTLLGEGILIGLRLPGRILRRVRRRRSTDLFAFVRLRFLFFLIAAHLTLGHGFLLQRSPSSPTLAANGVNMWKRRLTARQSGGC